MSLGKKQTLNNENWIETFERIEEVINKKEIDKITGQTLKAIKNSVKGKKSAYAWSAGKDSLVLGHIAEKAGIKDCMIGICNLEYPAFIRWIEEHMPTGLQIVNTGQDIEWLSKHLALLFPQDSSKACRWFSIVQHAAQDRYFKEHRLDLLLTGRRKADGNFVGKDNIYTNAKGITRYSPLADWSNEQILAYIHYNKIEMPPIYSWPNGYKCGTHPWPARQHTKDVQSAWAEIYSIDTNIVREAAQHIESAKQFWEGLKNGNC